MAASIRQEIAGNFTTASSTSAANTFASACLAGSTIEVWVTSGTNGTQPTVSDSAAQSYTQQATAIDGTDPQTLTLFTFQNNASATALTVTASWGATSVSNRGVWLREITGVGAAPLQNSTAVFKASPGVGADSIQTTTAISGTAPMLVSALAHANNAAPTAGVGTGFILGTSGWQQNGAGVGLAVSESQILIANTSVYGSFTNSNPGGSGNFIVGVAVYTSLSPNITAAPANQRASIGASQSVTFSLTASISSGGGSLTYQWYKNGISVGAGGTSATYSPTVNYPTDVGSYWYAIVTDSNGTTQSNSVTAIFGLEGGFNKRSPGLLDDGAQDYLSELTLLRWF